MAASAGAPSELETETAYGARVGGAWTGAAPNVAVFPPRSVGPADRGLLAVAVDLAGAEEGRGDLARLMVQASRTAYFNATGTITMGLRRAVEAANEVLYQANVTTLREMRRHAGISVAALVGADLYLGQAGPSLIYVVQAGELLQFPTDSPWLSSQDGQEAGGWYPLGVRRALQVDLYHVEVGDEDTVVLTSPAVAQLATGDFLDALLDQTAQDIVNDLANLASSSASNPDISVVALKLAGTGIETAPVPPEDDRGFAKPEDAQVVAAAKPSGPGLGEWLGKKSRDVAGDVGRGAGTVLKQTLPERPGGASALPRGPQVWRALAILIPLLVLAAVVVMTLRSSQERRAQDERVTALLAQAQERVTVAQGSAADRQSTLNLLGDADAKVQEALQIRPNNEAARKLQADIRTARDEAGGVYRLADWAVLASVPDTGAILRGLWVSGPNAYLLDAGLNRVLRVRPGEPGSPPEAVLKAGETVGGKTVGDLADLLWLRSGGARTVEDVAALGRDGVLWAVSATGTKTAIPVGGSRDWQNPLIADTYGGNFYLVQADRGQILRYTPSAGDAYNNAPTQWITDQTDLKGVVDMAIDGSIYLLMGDGRVRRFSAGKEEKFEVKGLEPKLSSPRGLFVSQEGQLLWVVEAGRVVEINKDGTFVRQFQAPDDKGLDDPRAVFVDEKAGRVYVVNGAALYGAGLPKPRPTRQ